MRFRLLALAVVILFLATFPAVSQVSRVGVGMSPSSDGHSTTLTFTFDANGPIRLTAGAPYSGRESTESIQTLADGTHIARPDLFGATTYRDSNGRVRTERAAFPNIVQFTIVEIQDPVAGYRYVLDSVNRIAHRAPMQSNVMPVRPAILPPPGTGRGPHTLSNGTIFNDEYLGTQTISGVETVGRRLSTTRPAGSPLGNDRPVTLVQENWDDPNSGVSLLWKVTDPAIGDHTTTIRNYSTVEPDPALFQVPAGYRTVDETGAFKIVVPRINRP